MNGVLGLTDVLMSKPMPPDQKKMLKVIDASGNALLNIINDILDFSKLDAGKIELDPRPFDLKDVLRDIHSLFETKAHEKGLYFRFKYPASCPTRFVGDQGRLRQILLNLVGNALKFTDTGGVVVVARMNTEHHLQIEIHDTGVGIETEKMEHLFGLFTQAESSTTRKYGGTGLGLAISRRLARAMGGDITVQSQLGDGAVFSVSLPLPEETSLKLAS
jgi:signal transduction histidine kinase